MMDYLREMREKRDGRFIQASTIGLKVESHFLHEC